MLGRSLTFGLVLALAAAGAHAQSFVNFESGHVRPLAASPDGTRLFAVNTVDNRLAVFDVTPTGLTPIATIPVGLEPVAVATRTNPGGRVEAWVVNHLSDSISVVEIDPLDVGDSRVVRTLLVGDEPRDIVFAGAGGNRVFVTAAHRGQNRPGDPQLLTEGIGRADVWVFDANALGAALGGTPLTVLTLFGDTPRALAATPDGSTVYAAVFKSGSRTTTIPEPVVTNTLGLPPPFPGSPPGAPETGLIVKFDTVSGQWRDELSRNWSPRVAFSLPDQDVFRIDANANPPAQTAAITDVGTVLFDMAVRPDTGALWVGNTEARNHVRFEGVVTATQGVRGHIAESRITVVNGTTATPRHLNPHVSYLTVPGPVDEVEESLAFPVAIAFSGDGQTAYVAGFGSEKVAVLDTDALEAGSVAKGLVEVGGGPSGLVLDEANDRLYVMLRFPHRIGIVTDASDPARRALTDSVGVGFDPQPPPVRNGRRVLYDARRTSAHGDAACASCHIFGDLDDLAWDLGDPTGSITANPNPFRTGSGAPFHPLKGPMTTQSLRGMADAGPMHWRGDRTGGSIGMDPLDEQLAFEAFNPAFVGLLGRGAELPDAEMARFTDFALSLRYPPNPIAPLDGTLTAAQAAGRNFFLTNPNSDGGNSCVFCHAMPLGTDGFSSVEGEVQEFKVAHLRNVYTKVGMFGVTNGLPGATGFLGPQVRGFGVLHDGSLDTARTFLSFPQFNFPSAAMRTNTVEFVLAFDTGLAPAVGQQVSATPSTFGDASVIARIDLLIARDDAGDCDLVTHGVVAGEPRSARYAGGNQFQTDRSSDPLVPKNTIRLLAATPGQEVTYTCLPPGNGPRAIDHDRDGVLDADERDAGTDPDDPTSFPGATPIVTVQTTSMTMKDDSVPPVSTAKRKITFKSSTRNDPPAHRIVPPAIGSDGDPSLHGAVLTVYNANGGGELVSLPLPASGWSPQGTSGWKYKGADSAAAITSVQLKADSLSLKGGKANWPYTLDEPNQGRIALRLALGTGVEWCAEALPKTSGNPPSTARSDRQDLFKSARKTAAPLGCPVPPPGSPSGAFLQ